ncbi:MAG: hypothetical protein K6A41_00820 [Bacteroidales bacterium]|nr:hypothetical protein [Bacteroidales bacterium]
MKKKKDQEDNEPKVCEPIVDYNRTDSGRPNAVSNPYSENMDDLMSVEEYFGKLRTMVNEYYDNVQSHD